MADQVAVKGQRDRSHIEIDDRDNARKWAKHFKMSEEELRRIVERVGNSVGTVRKECDFAKKAQMENKKAPAQATPGTNRSKPGAAPRPHAGGTSNSQSNEPSSAAAAHPYPNDQDADRDIDDLPKSPVAEPGRVRGALQENS